MVIDGNAAYRALQSRDPRFDGVFFVGVHTTGIYCRPSCSARTPHRKNIDFYPSAAAAQRAGFRACKRCRPDATPGSADWNARADLAGRAVRLIADGVVDRAGVPGLASSLGYSERQITRALVSEMGAPPLALARAQRAQTARILLERTSMTAADIAFAAGFSSIRQFNDTVREVFATTPSALRAAHRNGRAEPGVLELRLPFRAPMDLNTTLGFLAARAIPGVEVISEEGYGRTLPLPHGPALVWLRDGGDHVRATLKMTDHRDLAAAVARIRRLLDLDADPVAVDQTLSCQAALAPLVRQRAGLRSPGAVDPFEMVVRAIVGQQVSVAGARTILGRLAAAHGTEVFADQAGTQGAAVCWRMFPTPQALSEIAAEDLPMPRARGRSIISIARAIATGELVLDAGSDRATAREQLLAQPGIGTWTADYLLMRVLGHPDVYLSSDLGIKHALDGLGLRGLLDEAAAAPWRSYLTHHLWASLSSQKTTVAKDIA
ncbi:MAG: AraC family transcriptional regulator [Pseudonocardiales bacterium]|jgi:AraC family transcriptional regulator of adaptative response / DNA-3-methyladenine glycosylase II|nr:AraC family transcriptional regulator [Pseudonocardiales bacterium]